jgi:molybdopterin/thiamine biosynthesis adenylyltransferase
MLPAPGATGGHPQPTGVRPRLKDVVWQRDGERLRVVYDIRDHFLLPDPDGMVEALLELLAEGGRTVAELAGVFATRGQPVPVGDVAAAVELLDGEGLLEDGARLGRLTGAERERFFSNLAFFESFASLGRSREDFQQSLRDAHVLVLGTGGLNSNTIPHLCGLGVGRLTLLDRDLVEARNFARQYLYRHRDVGARKVALAAEWVRRFDPAITVEALDAVVDGAEQVGELVERYAPDVVMSGVDSPPAVDDWVNDGCVSLGVPYVRGGMWVTQGLVWSVDPGVSACRACVGGSAGADPAANDAHVDGEAAAMSLFRDKPRISRGIGPVAGLLGALCAFEVLRYLTRFEPPAYAGRPVFIDFANGCTTQLQVDPWPRNPGCPACVTAAGPSAEPDRHAHASERR